MNKPAPVGSMVHELVRERWSPRAFSDQPIDDETLRSLLEAAQWAPSSYNEQPWAFMVATRANTEAHNALLACMVPFNQEWAAGAPVLMLSVARTHFAKGGKVNRHAFHDVGLAVSQLTLQATASGLVVHQVAGIDVDKVRQTYDIPEGWDPVAALAIGHPGDPALLPEGLREKEQASRSRKPLSEIVFTGSWGIAARV